MLNRHTPDSTCSKDKENPIASISYRSEGIESNIESEGDYKGKNRLMEFVSLDLLKPCFEFKEPTDSVPHPPLCHNNKLANRKAFSTPIISATKQTEFCHSLNSCSYPSPTNEKVNESRNSTHKNKSNSPHCFLPMVNSLRSSHLIDCTHYKYQGRYNSNNK
jgi:hypothetical protein